MIDVGEIIMLIQDLVGILLNLIMFYILLFKLKLKGLDLFLMSFIGLLDFLFYLNSVLRISLLSYFNEQLELFPDWWCAWDASLTLTTIQTSLEMVAALALMRYLTICKQIRISFWYWLSICFLSIVLSISTSLYALNYKYSYSWSASKLVCLPLPHPRSSNGSYIKFLYLLFMARFILSLLIITFAYLSLGSFYKCIVKLNFHTESEHSLPEDLQVCNNNNFYLNNLSSHSISPSIKKVKSTKSIQSSNVFWIHLKIISMILFYIISVLPNVIISVQIALKPQIFNSTLVTCSHILMSLTGIINPLFVIGVHEPSKRQFIKLIESCVPKDWLRRKFIKDLEQEEPVYPYNR